MSQTKEPPAQSPPSPKASQLSNKQQPSDINSPEDMNPPALVDPSAKEEKYVVKRQKGMSNQSYQRLVKLHKLEAASREKQQLEKKLSYINNSITNIKNYGYLKGAPVEKPVQVHKLSRQELRELKRKEKDQLRNIREQQQKAEERKREISLKMTEKEKAAEELRKRVQEEEKERKKSSILQNVKKIKERIQHRQEENKQRNQAYAEVKKRKELFNKIEERYCAQQNSYLEERKKKLLQIRNIHRPINLTELQQHQKSFLQLKKERQEFKTNQKRLYSHSPQNKKYYKGTFYQQLQQKDQVSQQMDASRAKVEKMKQFALHVRDNFIPQIDQTKKSKIEEYIENESSRRRDAIEKEQNVYQKAEQTRQIGHNYLQMVKGLAKNPNARKSQVLPSNPKTEKTKYANYLTHSEHSHQKWNNILQSHTSRRDKASKMYYESERYEQGLKLKEEKARLIKGQGDAEEIDQEYYQMVKAKLDLLQS